ncbi:MAG TPA: hypothetical protein VD886_23935, partial [Herpetosiphonaceae bacterium]|nr:hypothetical protein [Herpetosiphonaceae bacterium]
MNRVHPRLLLVLAWILGIGLIAARPGHTRSLANQQPAAPMATINVTTPIDDFAVNNTCSLREAVYAAVHDVAVDACAAGAASDTISLPAATYALTLTG